MRISRSTLVWGGIFIIAGIALLLGNFLDINVWGFFFALVLLGFGVWILLGVSGSRRPVETETATIPLEGATQAHLRIRHGAGRLHLGGGTGPEELVTGSFGGGLKYQSSRAGDKLDVDMRIRERGFQSFTPWMWGTASPFDWSVSLNDEIPLSLEVDTGASETQMDLSESLVRDLELKTGVSSTRVTLPAHAGHTRVRINAGVASVNVRVPDGVAARIRAESGLANITVSRTRFPRTAGVYQSPNFDEADHKVDIEVRTGLGSITIH